MYSRLFSRSNLIKKCSLNHSEVGSHLSQTVSSIKPMLIRPLHLARNVQIFAASKIRVSNLRFSVCAQNGAKVAGKNTRSFGSSCRTNYDCFNVNTQVINNVYLYKYERPLFFKILNVSAVVQWIFWSGIAYFLYTEMPRLDDFTWMEYARENWLYMGLFTLACIAGLGGSSLIWTFSARSVKYVILNKGGKDVTIVAYHPLGEKAMKVPLENLKCRQSRKEMTAFLSMKMKDHSFYYILDSSGKFVNPVLFDYTVGLV